MNETKAAQILDEGMARAKDEYGIPSVAYGLVLNGRLVHAVDPARAYRIASMTKSFTAATTLLLRDRGLLRLDDPVVEHLPWVESIGLPPGSAPITIRNLLTMSGGLPTDDPWGDRQESLPLGDFDALVAAGLSFNRAPGTGFEYSNLGYALLGRVISRVTGEDYREFVTREILQPLGLRSTTYDVDRLGPRTQGYAPVDAGLVVEPDVVSGAFSPMGGLWSTVEDLARWVAFLESAWRAEPSSGPVRASSRREMQETQVWAFTEATTTNCYGYGLYVSIDQDLGRFVSHSGGYPGFGSHMRWHPESGWGVVALGNRTYAPMGKVAPIILADIVREDAADRSRQAARAAMWPQTIAAMDVAESLLAEWDDALLDQHAAVNLDMDRPRAERRADWQRVAAQTAGFVRRSDSIESRSPAHARWCVAGPGGEAWLEVLLSPERPPRIQTLAITGPGASSPGPASS